MQHAIFLRMRSTWSALSLWKRAIAVAVIVCLATQSMFVLEMWRESRIRSQLSRKVMLDYRKLPFPTAVNEFLNRNLPASLIRAVLPVEKITALDTTDDEVRALARFGRLKKLVIIDGRLSPSGLRSLAGMNSLEDLYLINDCTDAKSLRGLPTCPKLRKLHLIGRLTPEALDPLKNCAALEVLKLQKLGMVQPGQSITASHLAAVARIPNLKSLEIASSTIIAESDLCSLARARNLRELWASPVKYNGGGLKALGQLPQLSSVNLCAVTFEQSPKPLVGFSSLKRLTIHGGTISPEFLSNIAKLPELETLSLESCRVNESLHALAGTAKLKHLNLSGPDVTIEGIMQARGLESLEVITVSRTSLQEKLHELLPNLADRPLFDWQSRMMLSN